MRLRTSELGEDFPRERFLRTPVSTILWVLRELDDKEQAFANMQALPVARLTQLVVQIAHGFSGSKRPAPRIDIRELLPYPDFRPSSEEATGPEPGTRFVLTELVKQGRLPMHVFTALTVAPEPAP